MTTEQAKQTFLFDFIKSEMIARNTTKLTQDIMDCAYNKSVKFLSDEGNIKKIKESVFSIIKK